MSTSGRFLLLFFLLWAASWDAPCLAEQEGSPVQLVAPQAGATLVAGTTTALEWAPLDTFTGLPEVEEWEAFLSLDGGATYPVRITPHLDQDLRRVLWQVPDLPTSQAAILLRFGDEREETGVELPVRFSIAASPGLPDQLPLVRRVAAPGEAALPGQAGVVAWVEGSRRGGSLVQMVAAKALGGLREAVEPQWSHREVSEAAPEPPPTESFGRSAAKGAEPPVHRRTALAGIRTAPPLPSDILLLIQRQNE